MRTFTSKETIKARKVTDNDGEDVVTANGARHARKGDYVVDRDGAPDVMEKDDFETRFKAPSAPARKSASKGASKRAAKPQSTASARVRAAAKGKRA